MTHDSEQRAAAYLSHELHADDLAAFERHLLECDNCWREVQLGERGRSIAESARELAPAELRERIRRSMIKVDNVSQARFPGRRWIAAAVAALVLATGGLTVFVDRRPDISAITAAVSGYQAGRLPGSRSADAPGPDLSSLRLVQVGGGAGALDELRVTAYAYRDDTGRRLTIYIGSVPFPMPEGARPIHSRDGPWIATHEGIAVLCARHPHELLIVGADRALVRAAGDALKVM